MSAEAYATIAVLTALGLGMIPLVRWAYLLMLLFPASQGFGFLDPMSFAVASIFDVHAFMFALTAAVGVIFLKRWRCLSQGTFFRPLAAFVVLTVGAVIAPVIRDESSLWLAVEASKDSLMLLCYFAVVLVLSGVKDVAGARRIIVVFSVYYVAVSVFAQIPGTGVGELLTYDYRPEFAGLTKVYLPFWPIMLVTMLMSGCAYLATRRAGLALSSLMALGLALTFFRSYILATLASLPFLLVVMRASWASVFRALFVVCALAGVVVTAGLAAGKRVDLTGVADEFVVSGAVELVRGSGGALAGREVYARELRRLQSQRPLLGYGLINADSDLARHLDLPMFAGSVLGFIDKGSTDIAVKYGIVGGALYVSVFLWILLRAVKEARRSRDIEVRALFAAVAGLTFIYLAVLPVHAPLTYSFGLLPLGLLMGMADARRAIEVGHPDRPGLESQRNAEVAPSLMRI